MQPAKRQKLIGATPTTDQNREEYMKSAEDEQPNYFLDLLNDHCILEILAYLDLKNLCSIGSTCRHLYKLTKYYFGLIYPTEANKVKQFEKIERNWLFKSSSDDYIHCFADYKTITLNKNSMNTTLVEKFVNFQMNKPKENRIKSVRFKGFNDDTCLEKCKLLHAILLDVQVVSFVNVTANGFYDSILQYCPSMQKINIEGEFCVESNKWLSQIFPKLEHLSLHTHSDIEWKDIQQLFQQNPNIKVSLLTQNTENINRYIDNGVNINQLHIRVKYNIDYYIHYLKTICSKNSSIRLHLLIKHNVRRNLIRNIQHLVDLKDNIDGLHFDFDDIDPEIINAIMKIERLKVLQVPIDSHTQALAHLPNLKELYIYPYMSCDPVMAPQQLELLHAFAGHCKTLQKLVFRCPNRTYQQIGTYIVDSVNIRRKALDGAERLKFCFNIPRPVILRDTIDVLNFSLADVQPLW